MIKPEIVGNIKLFSVCVCVPVHVSEYYGMQVGQRTTSDSHPYLPPYRGQCLSAVQCCIHHTSWLRSLQGSICLHLPSHYERATLELLCVTTSGFTWIWRSELQFSPREHFPQPTNCSLKPLNSRGSLGGSNKQSKFPEHMKSSNKCH